MGERRRTGRQFPVIALRVPAMQIMKNSSRWCEDGQKPSALEDGETPIGRTHEHPHEDLDEEVERADAAGDRPRDLPHPVEQICARQLLGA